MGLSTKRSISFWLQNIAAVKLMCTITNKIMLIAVLEEFGSGCLITLHVCMQQLLASRFHFEIAFQDVKWRLMP